MFYNVKIPITGYLEVKGIEASSHQDAELQATLAVEKLQEQDVDPLVTILGEWEMHESVCEGNICYAVLNETVVEETPEILESKTSSFETKTGVSDTFADKYPLGAYVVYRGEVEYTYGIIEGYTDAWWLSVRNVFDGEVVELVPRLALHLLETPDDAEDMISDYYS